MLELRSAMVACASNLSLTMGLLLQASLSYDNDTYQTSATSMRIESLEPGWKWMKRQTFKQFQICAPFYIEAFGFPLSVEMDKMHDNGVNSPLRMADCCWRRSTTSFLSHGETQNHGHVVERFVQLGFQKMPKVRGAKLRF